MAATLVEMKSAPSQHSLIVLVPRHPLLGSTAARTPADRGGSVAREERAGFALTNKCTTPFSFTHPLTYSPSVFLFCFLYLQVWLPAVSGTDLWEVVQTLYLSLLSFAQLSKMLGCTYSYVLSRPFDPSGMRATCFFFSDP